MEVLEKTVKYLRKRTDQIFTDLYLTLGEQDLKKGQEKLKQILNKDLAILVDEHPEEMLLLANCELEFLELSDDIWPKVHFCIDIYKILLDALRQNARLLEFYNDTARNAIKICLENNLTREFHTISDTIYSHLNQIIKNSKSEEIMKKIPFPIHIDEDDTLKSIFELRLEQLKVGLDLHLWNDAFRTAESIYTLINT